MKKLLLMVALLTLAGCSSSPTGRSQVLLYDEAQMSQLGAQSFEEMKKNEKIVTDKAINRYVGCVADAITAQIPGEYGKRSWEVVVFDSEQVNAFALPGGHIGVYTGLLEVAKTPDQLATVIGHELAHVLASHSNERLSRNQLVGGATAAAAIAIGASDIENKTLSMAALGLGVQYGILLPYGRAQESEADIMGLDLMARAGFDPRQSVDLWQNMAKKSGGSAPEFLSTHPSHTTRISQLQGQFTQANALRQQALNQNLQPNCQRP